MYSNFLSRAPTILNRVSRRLRYVNWDLKSSVALPKREFSIEKNFPKKTKLSNNKILSKRQEIIENPRKADGLMDQVLTVSPPFDTSLLCKKIVTEQIHVARSDIERMVLRRSNLSLDKADREMVSHLFESYGQRLSRPIRRRIISIGKRSLSTSPFPRVFKNPFSSNHSRATQNFPVQASFVLHNPHAAPTNTETTSENQASGTAASQGASSTVPPPPPSSPSETMFGTMQMPPLSVSVLGPVSLKSSWLSIIFMISMLGLSFCTLFFLWRMPGLAGKILSSSYRPVTNLPLTLDDVKGNDEAKEEIQDLIDYLKDPKKYSVLSAKAPKGVLLVGPPGTGKTMLARALAGEAGVPFISTNGSEFEEMFVGVGAKRIRELFKTAKENAPCIVFIDEIDAVGGSRHDWHNRNKMSLNQLLVELDGFTESTGIILMGATNFPEVLDEALTRPGRFDRKVYLELPSKEARKEILEHYLKDKGAEDVDLDKLARATPGFSGADLFNMVNWAAIESIKKHKEKISMRFLDSALLNVAIGREKKSLVLSDESKRLCAFHEAGHAIVSLFTPGAMKIRKATLVPRANALGMVTYLAEEDPLMTKKQLLAQIDISMGGRAAEMMIYGDSAVTQGASSDFSAATKIAWKMVTEFGMSEKIGPVSLKSVKKEEISTHTKLLVEQEVKRLLEEGFERAKTVLKKHQKEMNMLAEALLKYETLSLEEIELVLKGETLDYKLQEQLIEKEEDDERKKKAEELKRKKPEIEIRKLRDLLVDREQNEEAV